MSAVGDKKQQLGVESAAVESKSEVSATDNDDKTIEEDPLGSEIVDEKSETHATSAKEAGEIDEFAQDDETTNDAGKTYFWCKCPCDPNQYAGVTHYYLHLQTSESRWDEPDEPYWLYDPVTAQPDPTSLQQPKKKSVEAAAEPPEDYQGYNPKIHGNYDPNAPYAKYHENKRKEKELAEHRAKYGDAPMPGDEYSAIANFNSRTGKFQTSEQTVEHHSDASKSYRQLHAFYDVDAAANAHNGQSLKAARQQQKLSKKELEEMKARRKEKKMKKRLDWLKS